MVVEDAIAHKKTADHLNTLQVPGAVNSLERDQ